MTDKKITCITCGEEFEFTAGEQTFYNEKGFNEPKKCKTCRDASKSRSNRQSFNQN